MLLGHAHLQKCPFLGRDHLQVIVLTFRSAHSQNMLTYKIFSPPGHYFCLQDVLASHFQIIKTENLKVSHAPFQGLGGVSLSLEVGWGLRWQTVKRPVLVTSHRRYGQGSGDLESTGIALAQGPVLQDKPSPEASSQHLDTSLGPWAHGARE